MVYNRFSISVIILSVLVSLSGAFFIWTLQQDHLTIAKFSSCMVWIILTASLIIYVNQTNRSLENFLDSLINKDSSKPFPQTRSESFSRLNIKYSDIIDTLQDEKTSRARDYEYFRSLIENSGTGMLVFDDQENADIVNRAAREIFMMESPGKLEGLNRHAKGFSDFVRNMDPGKSSLFRTIIDYRITSLAVRKVDFYKEGEKFILLSVQNIHGMLEEEEIEAWKKLISVLTHEIMNSVSPIKSLSGTLIRLLKSKKGSSIIDPDVLIEGLEAIDKRSDGLITFVDAYQKLSKVPDPVYTLTDIDSMITNVISLVSGDKRIKDIDLYYEPLMETVQYRLDENLISQVLINLISNSAYALENIQGSRISIQAKTDQDRKLSIEISDNGKGITPDIMGKIFIPFYTTREGGSGIGLSLSRQIMSLHNGSLTVKSDPGIKTVFTLVF